MIYSIGVDEVLQMEQYGERQSRYLHLPQEERPHEDTGSQQTQATT